MPTQQEQATSVAAVVRKGTDSMADKAKAGLGTYLVGGRKQAKSGGAGTFRVVPTPGSGVAHVMNERVYAKAAQRASDKIREFVEMQVSGTGDGGGRKGGRAA